MKSNNLTILNFGKYKNQAIEKLEDECYLKWIAKPKYHGGYYKSLHVTDLKWRVPFEIRMVARKELEKRGYKLIGEHWEK